MQSDRLHTSSVTALSRHLVPIALVLGLFLVFLPLPGPMMDFFIACNLGASVLILVTAFSVPRPLDFSLFPTLLVITTLARLFLNIATTRLILTQAADDRMQAAGAIVASFAHYLAGNDVLVGAIIFVILVVVQLVVVNQGASRVSEVGARFTLDGLPGRQMTIDAELNSGAIDLATARRQRQELLRQSDFFGGMDGASKFIRGDAIAGIVITLVNIFGGLYQGVIVGGMDLADATSLYTKLTIGDGLASQFPGLLIAIAAGVLATRCSESVDFSSEFLRQTVFRKDVGIIVAGFLGALIFAGLPALPLILVGLPLGIWSMGRGQWTSVEPASEPKEAAESSKPKVQERPIQYDPLELELGADLLALAKPGSEPDLLTRIARLRDRFTADWGLVLPRVRVRDNLRLGRDEFRLKVLGHEALTARLDIRRTLAVASNSLAKPLRGIAAGPHLVPSPAWWIDPEEQPQALAEGYRLLHPIEALMQSVQHALRQNLHRVLTRDAVQGLLDAARTTLPATIQELSAHRIALGTIQGVLQRLLRERVSLRQLPVMLECLCDEAGRVSDLDELTERVRVRVASSITQAFRDHEYRVRVVRLAPELELAFGKAAWESRDPKNDPELQSLTRGVSRELEGHIAFLKSAGLPAVLLVPQTLRRHLAKWLGARVDDLFVLGDDEITSDAKVLKIATVSLMAMAA